MPMPASHESLSSASPAEGGGCKSVTWCWVCFSSQMIHQGITLTTEVLRPISYAHTGTRDYQTVILHNSTPSYIETIPVPLCARTCNGLFQLHSASLSIVCFMILRSVYLLPGPVHMVISTCFWLLFAISTLGHNKTASIYRYCGGRRFCTRGPKWWCWWKKLLCMNYSLEPVIVSRQ